MPGTKSQHRLEGSPTKQVPGCPYPLCCHWEGEGALMGVELRDSWPAWSEWGGPSNCPGGAPGTEALQEAAPTWAPQPGPEARFPADGWGHPLRGWGTERPHCSSSSVSTQTTAGAVMSALLPAAVSQDARIVWCGWTVKVEDKERDRPC